MTAFFNNGVNGQGSRLEPENIAVVDKEPHIACEWKYTEDFKCFVGLALLQMGSYIVDRRYLHAKSNT